MPNFQPELSTSPSPAKNKSHVSFFLCPTFSGLGCGNKHSKNINNRGFSLIELLAVVGIMGVLASFAIPQVMSAVENARYAASIQELRRYANEIMMYRAQHGAPPSTWSDLEYASPPVDPWGNEYVLNNHDDISSGKRRKDGPTVPINSHFDVFSAGPDDEWKSSILADKSQDDVIVAGDGQYVGKAEDY